MPGSGCCAYRASCIDCSRRQGGEIARALAELAVRRSREELVEPEPSPGPADGCWDALTWLADLRDVPDDATWPRFMTQPHPAAVGSLVVEFEAFVLARTGRRLLWFQHLVAARVLEVDAAGRLVWLSWFVTLARQLGKSFFVVNLLLFVVQRAGELWPAVRADVLYTSRTLLSAESLVRGLLAWARDAGDDWRALRANGQKAVTWRESASVLIRSVDAVYGETCGLVVVDESWDVAQSAIDESIEHSTMMAEGQVGFTSTAHRRATSTCLRLREVGLTTLAEPDELLIVEWSAAPWRELDDEDGWREASPRWTEHRRRRLVSMLGRARAGESIDPTEPDPIAAFSTQGLNRWPAKVAVRTRTELLVAADAWARCEGTLEAGGAGWVALEDNFGDGAAVAFATEAAGRFEVDGLVCASWDEALVWMRKFAEDRPGSCLIAGASTLPSVPLDMPGRALIRKGSTTETRLGLSLLRSLVAEGRVVHDRTLALDAQLFAARVKVSRAGLELVPGQRSDLLRAAVWALWAAQQPPPVLGIAPG